MTDLRFSRMDVAGSALLEVNSLTNVYLTPGFVGNHLPRSLYSYVNSEFF
jgi:hypothetical protein